MRVVIVLEIDSANRLDVIVKEIPQWCLINVLTQTEYGIVSEHYKCDGHIARATEALIKVT